MPLLMLHSLQDAAGLLGTDVAALGTCATKMLGKGAAPGAGAQEKLQKGEESPFPIYRTWIAAALWRALDQGDITAPYH